MPPLFTKVNFLRIELYSHPSKLFKSKICCCISFLYTSVRIILLRQNKILTEQIVIKFQESVLVAEMSHS